MATQQSFLSTVRGKDAKWLAAEIVKHHNDIRRLRFDLTFGNVGALSALRVAKRELAQLLTVQAEQKDASVAQGK